MSRATRPFGLPEWLGNIPVPAVAGLIRGAWWTMYPCSAYWRGTHELQTQLAFHRLLPARGGSAWDLGAHFGYYSVALARAVGIAGQVAAFEPSPASYRKLVRHVALNRLSQVRTFCLAVSDCASDRVFVQNQGTTATTAHLPYPGEAVEADGDNCLVRTCRLDDLVRGGQLRAPTFVKLDVEGHGAEALRGARATLTRVRPTLLVSYHSPQELAGVREVLEPLGYAHESLQGQPVAWEEIGLGEYVARPIPQ